MKVYSCVFGAKPVIFEAKTIGDVRKLVTAPQTYQAKLNGKLVSDSTELTKQYSLVFFIK